MNSGPILMHAPMMTAVGVVEVDHRWSYDELSELADLATMMM